MFCPKCGTENKDTATFCKECGAQLRQVPGPVLSAGLPASLSGGIARQRRRGWPISGIGALLALICFFLPWITVSCGGARVLEVSGQELAAGSTFYGEKVFGYPQLWVTLLVPLICLIIVGVAYSKGNMSRGGAVGQIVLTGAGLIPILTTFLDLTSQSGSDEWISEGLVTVSTKIGLWGTFLGYLGIVAGAILDLQAGSRMERTTREVEAKREIACSECGTANPLDAKFCKHCGANLPSTEE